MNARKYRAHGFWGKDGIAAAGLKAVWSPIRGPLSQLWRGTTRYSILLIMLLGVLVLGLGFTGFHYCPALGYEPYGPAINVYRASQLLVLNGSPVCACKQVDAPKEDSELHADCARSRLLLAAAAALAPLFVLFTAAKALFVIFGDHVRRLWAKHYMSGHVIICGLGTKGLLFAKRFLQDGDKVVVIERDEQNDFIRQAQELGAIVLRGSAEDAAMLETAGIARADKVMCVCGDDGTNAEISVRCKDPAANRPRGGALVCVVHIFSPELCTLLRPTRKDAGIPERYRLELFNIFQNAAWTLLHHRPPFGDDCVGDCDRPHILLVGLGRLGQSLLVQAAGNRRHMNSDRASDVPLHVTVVDREAERKTRFLLRKYPALAEVCVVRAVNLEIESGDFQSGSFLTDSTEGPPVTFAYICIENQSVGMAAGMTLKDMPQMSGIPIVVRTDHETGFAAMLPSDEERVARFGSLEAFGLFDRTCEPDMVLGIDVHILARALHKRYVATRLERGETPESNRALASWDELSDEFRESNLDQARSIGLIELEAEGFAVSTLTDWSSRPIELTEQEKSRLAEKEHERWRRERIARGWKPGPVRDEENKINPHLKPWNELSDDQKHMNIEFIESIPQILHSVGYELYRLK